MSYFTKIFFYLTLSPNTDPRKPLIYKALQGIAAYIWLLWGLHCQVEWGRKALPCYLSPPLPYPIGNLLYTFFTHFLLSKTVNPYPNAKTSRAAHARDAQKVKYFFTLHVKCKANKKFRRQLLVS